jgi:hypothetical protein
MKGRADGRGSAESCQAADVLHWFSSDLQQHTSAVDACIGEPRHGRHSGLFAKPAGERSSRHMCVLGESVEVERECQVFEHPVAKRSELVAARRGRPVIPGARMTVLDATGHLSPLEIPDQIANEIDQFVAGVGC